LRRSSPGIREATCRTRPTTRSAARRRATPRSCRSPSTRGRLVPGDPRVFFAIHDPTTLNRQGADVGESYRSAIFYHDEEQRRIAEEMIAELEAEGVWDDPIVTEVTPFGAYYRAEDYHQNYFRTTGSSRTAR
jgi:hypothetical protein